jgi:NTE family protein
VTSNPDPDDHPALGWSHRLGARWTDRRRRWARARDAADAVDAAADGAPPPARTAFVLAGGGSRGAVQVGMLSELIRRGIKADRVYGASVGAINGGAYAGDPTLEGIEHMADIWRGIKATDIFPRAALDGPWAFFQKRDAVHANSGLRRIIEAGMDYENLQDARIPIEVVTTSLTDGRERWITHGPAIEAIMASSAIPSIFPPVVIDGDVLVDGGVVNNVPISRALAAG